MRKKDKIIDKIIDNIFHKKNFVKRTAAVIVSVITMGFAVSLLINVNMGTDPCSSMNLGVSKQLGLSLGNWLVLFNLLLFIIVIRYDYTKIGIGTLVNMVLVGYSVDFFSWVWNKILPMNMFHLLFVRIAVLIPTLVIFIIAVATKAEQSTFSDYSNLLGYIGSGNRFYVRKYNWDCDSRHGVCIGTGDHYCTKEDYTVGLK